jgi:hypothetical protein
MKGTLLGATVGDTNMYRTQSWPIRNYLDIDSFIISTFVEIPLMVKHWAELVMPK